MVRIAVATLAFLAGLGTAIQAPLDGYKVEDFTWGVDAYGNGTIVDITGPVQNVYEQLKKINPDLVKDVNTTTPNATNTDPAIRSRMAKDFGPVCGDNGHGWLPAKTIWIEDGIEYLRKVPGQPVRGPGPGSCGRVSCSWASAIWWCNEKDTQATLPSFNTIADCAQVLDWDCYISPFRCLGQNFNAGDWNCIVRQDTDDC